MEGKILDAEEELAAATADLENPEGLADPLVYRRRNERLQKAQKAVDQLYERWAELEAKLGQ